MIKQSDPHKRGRASRTKGKNAELELMHILRDFYGYPVRRGKVFYHESDVVGLPGIHIEVKRRDPMALRDAMAQAVREARIRKDGVPTVFARADRRPWIVCSLYNDLARMAPPLACMRVDELKVMRDPYDTPTMYQRIKVEGQPLCVLDLETWMDLYGAWEDAGNG